jgi:hypothetical protein
VVKREVDYFFALQVGQVAQVVLPSAQQAIPQADFAVDSFLQQVEEQPLMTAATQMSAMTVTMDFIFWFGLMFRPPAQVQTNRFATAASQLES